MNFKGFLERQITVKPDAPIFPIKDLDMATDDRACRKSATMQCGLTADWYVCFGSKPAKLMCFSARWGKILMSMDYNHPNIARKSRTTF